MFVEIFILCLLAYLCGSIPFGMLLAKTQNIDIREHGSGNIGATNVTRIMGKKAGFITLIGDVLKGWAIVFLASQWFEKPIFIALAGFMVFFGHLYSIFLRFKGGKGVATYLGILLALSIQLGLLFMFTWLVVSLIFKYSSVSSMFASLTVFVIHTVREVAGPIFKIMSDQTFKTYEIASLSLLLFIFFILIIFI